MVLMMTPVLFVCNMNQPFKTFLGQWVRKGGTTLPREPTLQTLCAKKSDGVNNMHTKGTNPLVPFWLETGDGGYLWPARTKSGWAALLHRCPFWLVCSKNRGPGFTWWFNYFPGPSIFQRRAPMRSTAKGKLPGCSSMLLEADLRDVVTAQARSSVDKPQPQPAPRMRNKGGLLLAFFSQPQQEQLENLKMNYEVQALQRHVGHGVMSWFPENPQESLCFRDA